MASKGMCLRRAVDVSCVVADLHVKRSNRPSVAMKVAFASAGGEVEQLSLTRRCLWSNIVQLASVRSSSLAIRRVFSEINENKPARSPRGPRGKSASGPWSLHTSARLVANTRTAKILVHLFSLSPLLSFEN